MVRSARCEQDSNLRGETPLDFESNALTTRPSQLWLNVWVEWAFKKS